MNTTLLLKLRSRRLLAFAVFMFFAFCVQAESGAAASDEVVLKNGSILLGTVTVSRDGVITVETDFAGTLDIALDHVASVKTARPMMVLMEDESVVHDTSMVIAEEQLVMASAGQTYPLADLRVVNPQPWELGQGYRWTGAISFAVGVERGNTDTDELDAQVESVWRSTRDRFTLKADGETDKADGKKTADQQHLLTKYDYFLIDPNYWGLMFAAERDEFRDLDLRYLIGPYYGRQFYARPIFSLSGELGLSYVTEKFDVAEDQDYGATTWNLQASSNYLGGESSLYFDQLGVWSLKDTSDVIVNSTFGLSFPLLWNLEAAVEILLDYDSGAVEGVDELDQTYKVRMGYTW